MVSARRSSIALWGRCLAVVESDISRKADAEGRLHASWVGGSNSDGLFPLGAREREFYALLHRIIEDLVARLQAAATSDNANILSRVRDNAMRRTAVCLEMYAGSFEWLL